MNRRLSFSLAAVFLIGAVAATYAGYRIGMRQGAQATSGSAATAGAASTASTTGSTGSPQTRGDIDPATGKRVLYWHDPMVPGQKFDRPGKSPFMDMMLVPVYADDDGGDAGGVKVNARLQQNLGLRTAEVAVTPMASAVTAIGTIAYNERDQVVVQARANGYVERLYVRATLDRVTKGQPLVELFIPDWIAAQEEFLAVRRLPSGPGTQGFADAARQRMRLVGMNDEQIRAVEASGEPQPRMRLVAPLSGLVTEIAAREGMTVMVGATLFRVNGIGTVWANVEVPEGQAALVRPGARIEARSPALPGTMLQGRVQAILPQVEASTRTIRARVELANPGARLAPGMTVNVSLSGSQQGMLTVPSEAIIQTGKRSVVMLAEADGRFRPVDVEIGMESNGRAEIRKGLQAGQKVVVSGQFLIDSESSLRAVETRTQSAGDPSLADASPGPENSGEGRIEAIDKDSVTLSHGPIPSMKWGPMTMGFGAPPSGLPPGLQVGQQVRFSFVMGKDGMPVLVRIAPIGSTAAASPGQTGSKR